MTAYYLRLNSERKKRKVFRELQNRCINLKTYLFNKKINKDKAIFQTNTHCIHTGSSKSVYKHFSLSRHSLRHFLNRGYFPMCSQSSW